MLRRDLLDLLVCPRCGRPLEDRASQGFQCSACRALYPLADGLPVLLPEPDQTENATARAFAQQWSLQDEGAYEKETIYGETSAAEMQSCLDRLGIEGPAALGDRRCLDIGCGSGRLTRNLARYAPNALVVGGDRSLSAHIAHRRCADLPNAFVAQLDLLRPPFADGSFDYVYADGVLPHVPDPDAALASLDRLVRPGGRLFIWIYPRSFSPYRMLRDALVRPHRLPIGVQRAIEWTFGIPLWAAFKLYEGRRGPRHRSLREVVFMLHDNLAPEFQHRRRPEEVVAAFAKLGYIDIRALDPPAGVVGTKPAKASSPAAAETISAE